MTENTNYDNFEVPNDLNKSRLEEKLSEIYGEPFQYRPDTFIYNYSNKEKTNPSSFWIMVQDSENSFGYSITSGDKVPNDLKKELFEISMKGLKGSSEDI